MIIAISVVDFSNNTTSVSHAADEITRLTASFGKVFKINNIQKKRKKL